VVDGVSIIDKLNQEVAFTITDLNYTALKAPRPIKTCIEDQASVGVEDQT
jgi:hypothetical protein